VSLQVPVFWTLTCDRLVIGPLAKRESPSLLIP
jgi:hypothetical protein